MIEFSLYRVKESEYVHERTVETTYLGIGCTDVGFSVLR
jgi:hypothetical protein